MRERKVLSSSNGLCKSLTDKKDTNKRHTLSMVELEWLFWNECSTVNIK